MSDFFSMKLKHWSLTALNRKTQPDLRLTGTSAPLGFDEKYKSEFVKKGMSAGLSKEKKNQLQHR